MLHVLNHHLRILYNGFLRRQLIVRNSKDPTFVFLAILWSALYAWDEALEALYAHFSLLVSRTSFPLFDIDLHSSTPGIARDNHQ